MVFTRFSSQSSQPNQLPRCYSRRLIRSIGIALVVLMALLGLAMIINWLIVMPKKVIFTVENGYITNHTVTDTRIKGTFVLQIKSFNPNRKGSIRYESMKIVSTYLDQKVVTEIKPFSQSPRNETNLDIRFNAEFVSPFGHMRKEITRDGIKLSVRIKAKIRFKVSGWMAKGRLVEILCPSVVEYIDSARNFERVTCLIDF